MTTKYQRRMLRVAANHGVQFALERTVLNAARALMGSARKHGRYNIALVAWARFEKAENALYEFHAERQRRKK